MVIALQVLERKNAEATENPGKRKQSTDRWQLSNNKSQLISRSNIDQPFPT